MKYKKILLLTVTLLTNAVLLSEKKPAEKKQETLAEREKKLFKNLCAACSAAYQETVAVTALHFILRNDEEAIEIKLAKKTGELFYKIALEFGDYGKALFFLPVSRVAKAKRFFLIATALCVMYFTVNSLSNRHKTFEKDKTIHK
jgi:hypothetical protein